MSGDRVFRCKARVGTVPCGFEGSEEKAAEHAAATGHVRCVVDGAFLAPEETRVCGKCISRTRDALTTIRDAHLEDVLEATAERTGQVPATLLAMVAPGNTDAPKPYKPVTGSREVTVGHGGLVGSVSCWLPYWEHRKAADGKEHYADHWRSDPLIPLAELDNVAVSWHGALGEPRRVPVPDGVPPVVFLCDYLLHRLWAAKNVAPDVNDDFPLLWQLAAQVANTAGIVNRPEKAPARCFDCGGDLISPYREPVTDIPVQGRRGTRFEGREFADTDDPDESIPIWTCADCDRVYQPAEYWLALKAALMDEAAKAG